MQTFQDKLTRQHYSFEDDVKISKDPVTGALRFTNFVGQSLSVPETLEPATDPEPDGARAGEPQSGFVQTHLFIQRLESLNLWEQVAAAIHAIPALNLKFSTSPFGVSMDDAQIREILIEVGASPDAVLKA